VTKRATGKKNAVLSPDFLDFITCLNRHSVDYVLVGGYALAIHGVVRATGDIDFLYRRTERNVKLLCKALDDFGAPPNIIDPDALLAVGIVTQFGAPPYRIDLLNDIDGVTFGKAWSGAIHTKIEGQKLRVIGRSDLRANKSATGRSRDLDDAGKLAPQRGGKGARAKTSRMTNR
jgi:hypothetical protein